MSLAVTLMASIASSRLTLWIPSPASASCAAVTALTAPSELLRRGFWVGGVSSRFGERSRSRERGVFGDAPLDARHLDEAVVRECSNPVSPGRAPRARHDTRRDDARRRKPGPGDAPINGVARESQRVLHGDLSRLAHLLGRAAHARDEGPGRHRARDADLGLAAALGGGDGRAALVEHADCCRVRGWSRARAGSGRGGGHGDAPAEVSKKVLMSRSGSSDMNSIRYLSTDGMTPDAPCCPASSVAGAPDPDEPPKRESERERESARSSAP